MTRKEIVAYAMTWLGTPFVHQARVRGHGGDCVAMVEGAALHFGIIEQGYRTNYGREPKMREIIGALTSAGCRRLHSISERQAGDILFIQWASTPQHLGILTGENPERLIHGYSGAGKYVQTNFNGRLLEGLRQVWRFPGVTD